MTKRFALPKNKRKSRRQVLVALALAASVAAALVVFTPAPQSADAVFSGSTGRTGCSAVNMGHTKYPKFYYYDLTLKVSQNQDWVRTNVINTTHISASTVSDFDANTNVVMMDGAYESVCGFDWYNEIDGGTLALTTCDTIYSSGDCRQHSIRVSTNYIGGATTSQRRGLLCHESGHAFGLMHASNSNSCMKYGVANPAQDWDATETAQINANY